MLAQPIDGTLEQPGTLGPDMARPACFDMPGGLRVVMTEGEAGLIPQRGGKMLPPPMIRVALPRVGGDARQLIIFRAEAATKPIDLLARDGRSVGRVEAKDFASLDRAALTQGLDATGKLRLVRQMLDVCRDLFQLRHDTNFGRFCRAILADIDANPRVVAAEAVVSQHLALMSAPLAVGEVTDLFVVGDRGIATATFNPLKIERGRGLFLLERAQLKPGNLLVMVGADGLATARIAALPQTPFLTWLQNNKPLAAATRRFVMRCVGEAATGDASAAALLRELELFQPATRRNLTDRRAPLGAGIDLLVADGKGGIFVKGWVRDPHQLMQSATLRATGLPAVRLDETWLCFPRPDIDKHYDGRAMARGFVAFLPEAGQPRGQARLELQLGSGAVLEILAGPAMGSPVELRDAVLGAVPPEYLTTDAIARVIAPAAESLHVQHLAARRAPDLVQLGTPVDQPRYSIIIPLYRNLDYLRFQLGSFAIDPVMAETEIIFVLDSPEQRAELVHFLSGLHQLYRLPLTILIMSANFGYAAANNAAAGIARGQFLLLLNSDVVPESAGWLPKLAAPLLQQKKAVATGARLLFDDQSLQHAGMRFTRDAGGHWLNLHYHKGAPRDFAPALETRAVPAVTGAALLVRREAFRKVGGFTEDYIIGDYEDSDLCLKLRQAGGEIFYCPEAVLFHFERKSINRHAGYQRSVAGLYNRWLAGQRWHAAMLDLCSRFDTMTDGAGA
ncbi:glycosyltransferase family 2 protein [Dongia rigui]|uniref:Glycosyltransferase family 2 protein n=1 Tax=Dongia rigui TaxID=940149 RepID=A0ABU5DUB5_9PROT|nr:glycosyltransferase family 2 protein [Dongia rigui]MDY0870923.1 glycosyltransferase family 2 protein [Dongia rigui]